jgi:hypothetical protein
MAIAAKSSPTALLPSGTNFPQYSYNANPSGSAFIPSL